MGYKGKNLNELKSRGINVHEYEIFTDKIHERMLLYMSKNCLCTFRADPRVKRDERPFLVYRCGITKEEEILEFINECKGNNYDVVASDGLRFDAIQEYNLVVMLKDDEIRIEGSGDKVPLRKMYKNTINFFAVIGELSENVRSFESYGTTQKRPSSAELERVLNKIYEIKEAEEHTFELTVYPREVGVLNEKIVFWQIY